MAVIEMDDFRAMRLQHAQATDLDKDPTLKFGEARRRLVAEWTISLEAFILGYQPTLVICETVPITGAANASGQRIKALMIVVVSQAICVKHGIEWDEVAANTVKKRVTGIGDATKPKVREAVINVFPELVDRRKAMIATPDISDAIAVALTGAGYDYNASL